MGYTENDTAEERTATCEDGSIQNTQTEAEWEKSSKNKEENKKQTICLQWVSDKSDNWV